jgi:Tannase and feruloyl esterase
VTNAFTETFGGSGHLLSLAIASLATVGFHAGTSHAATSCASIIDLSLPNTTVPLAKSYLAGQTVSGLTKAPIGLCRIAGTARPSSDSNIKFEVWIPTDGSWNGKYEQIGNGGFAGSIWLPYIVNAVARGYAAAATDDGTSGPPRGAAAFLGHPAVQIDYGYRAIKVTTDSAKAIIKQLTGANPNYSYFSGCSDGGREALMEAQRYPNDFDGIIAGSPANDFVGLLGSSFLWNMRTLLSGPQTRGVPDAYIPASKLVLLSNSALSQCAGSDGGLATDAYLNNPRACHFDARAAGCKLGQDSLTCLTPAQIESANKIYRGPHDSSGELIFPGYEPGSESNAVNWPEWLVGTSSTSVGTQHLLTKAFWCDQVLKETNCPLHQISKKFDNAVQMVAPVINSTNPDLRQFAHRGGKLIQYAGWADTAIAPQNGINYYKSVTSIMGDPHAFYRIFMAPGMAYCYGGAGPNSFGNGTSDGPVVDPEHDLLKALEMWTEHGVAPDKIIAAKYLNDNPALGVAFQRPLCPYPQIAKYNGHGNTIEPSSFECTADESRLDPENDGVQAAYR